MNRAYRVVWNATTNTWSAVSELAASRRKGTSRRALAAAMVLTATFGGAGFVRNAQAFTPIGTGAQQGNAGNLVIGDNADGSKAGCNSSYLPGSACSTIIGNGASSTSSAATVVGDHATTTGANATAIGAYATAASWSQAFGAGAQATGGWATAIGQGSVASNANASAIGTNSTATGNASTAIGGGAHATGDSSFAIGWNSNASATGSMAFGTSVTVAGVNSVALGLSSGASADYAIAIGGHAAARTVSSTALGDSSTASGLSSTAIGGNSVASGDYSATLGMNASASAANSAAVGAGSTTTANLAAAAYNPGSTALSGTASVANGEVSVGSAGKERRVTNVAAGSAATDAVNVSQLQSEAAKSNAIGATTAVALGGGSTYNPATGSIGAPTYNVAGGTQHSVGDALDALNGGVNNNATNISNLTNNINQGTIGLVQQDPTSRVITVAKDTNGTSVSFTGTAGDRTLTGVSAGVAGTDAVNVSQLQNVQSQIGTQIGDATRYFKADGRNDGTDDASVVAGSNSLAIGAGSVADRANTVSVGAVGAERQITNVAAGKEDTDAVNVSQLKDAGLIGDDGKAIAAVTYDQNADGTPNYNSVTMGGSKSTGPVAIHNVADGADGNDAVNVNQLQAVQNQIGTQIGDATRYFKADGRNDGTDDASVVAGSNSVAIGAGSVATLANSVSVGSVGNERYITNVKAGVNETDAVNVSQLSALQSQVTNIDGRVTNLEGGAGKSPYFDATDNAQTGDYEPVANVAQPGTGVGSTAAGSGATVTGNYGTAVGSNASASGENSVAMGSGAAVTGTNSVAVGSGSQATANNAVALGQGSVADRDNSVSVGSASGERQITNVAAGSANTDAVNVGQLTNSVSQGVQQANNYTDQRFNDANNAINSVAKNAYAGIAAAMAMPNMTPSGPGRTIVAAGAANFKGGSAVAAGATYRSTNSKWLVNGAVSVTSAGDAGVRAQVGYEF
ncbi:hypothetical protein LMG24238_02415 [Paraburkholderia sediminicola]|uniref:Autotransporter adhesin n=1 Tax=Paraburkholderia sediminicola TaxID=458836 RepID=A0A6J5ARB2_9BURK|nr:ESPR-type extended signal peptide-containing protein [Paraburkholderia sediminicola]CAB3677024.1 hypothetical protein LMG24238_02415 [Paraburkholderia sediminicola]